MVQNKVALFYSPRGICGVNVEVIVCCCKAHEIPGVKIFRFSSSLYYANVDHFVRKLYKTTDCDPEDISKQRVRQERQRAEATSQRKKLESIALKRKTRLKITADHDDRMFTVMYSTFYVHLLFSALTLLVGRQEGHPACKKLSGGMLAWLSAMRCRLCI